MLQRIIFGLCLMIIFSACGQAENGQATAIWQPATSLATPVPPTATIVVDSTIPLPPNHTLIQAGEYEDVDFLIATMLKPMLEKSATQQGELKAQTYFTTSLSIADVRTFYTAEMAQRGWQELENGVADTGTGIMYYRRAERTAFIMAIDDKLLGIGSQVVTIAEFSK